MTANFPPENYLPAESKLEGIQVFVPAPADQGPHQPVVEFKCPQCGATTAYSAVDGGLTCTHCGYFEPPEKPVVGKGAQEFEFTVETMQRAASGWGEARKEMACQSCGAVTTLPADALTVTCAFCGSNNVLQREAPQDVLRPRFLVPFKIDRAACTRQTQAWLESSWMTPSGLKRLSALAAFTPVYLPYWTFDSTTQADWKAEVGHTETERYRENNQWKTRTVIRWRWESGEVRLNIDDLVLPGTQKLSKLLLGRLQDFRLTELVPYEPKFLAGMQARAYDLPLEAAWEQAREQMREQTRQACRSQASTSQIRNFSMNLDFSQESWRYILLPVYVAAYRFQSQNYQVMVNGQTGAVSGQRPVDWTKVWLVIAALLAPGILLGLVGLLTLLFGGVGVVIGGFGLILLVIGMVISFIILQKAMSLDDI
jgi:DNA-directed RNA polymerase subunit RPC12/RpoP